MATLPINVLSVCALEDGGSAFANRPRESRTGGIKALYILKWQVPSVTHGGVTLINFRVLGTGINVLFESMVRGYCKLRLTTDTIMVSKTSVRLHMINPNEIEPLESIQQSP